MLMACSTSGIGFPEIAFAFPALVPLARSGMNKDANITGDLLKEFYWALSGLLFSIFTKSIYPEFFMGDI
jgi:hypothetical protein